MNARMNENVSNAAFTKDEYEAIRAQLTFRPSILAALLTLTLNAVLLALAVHLISGHAPLGYVAAQLLLPLVWFQAFSILHDCGHGSFTTNRTANIWIGHYASVLCFLPFFPWKYIHTEHHVWAGNADKDPGLALVRRARATGTLPWLIRAAWRTWVPLGGFAQHIVYWSYPITALRRGALSRDKLLRCVFSVSWLALAYALLAHFFPTIVAVRVLWPAFVLYLFVVELVNIPHHSGLTSVTDRLPLWLQYQSTRTCDYPPIVSELLALNFNLHIEHHLFPNLPWYRLRAARRLLRPALGARYRETHSIGWHIEQRKHSLVTLLKT